MLLIDLSDRNLNFTKFGEPDDILIRAGPFSKAEFCLLERSRLDRTVGPPIFQRD